MIAHELLPAHPKRSLEHEVRWEALNTQSKRTIGGGQAAEVVAQPALVLHHAHTPAVVVEHEERVICDKRTASVGIGRA